MSEDRPAVAVFVDRGQAAQAADELRRAGFADQDLGFAMQQRTGMGAADPGGQAGTAPSGRQGERTGNDDRDDRDDRGGPGGSGTVAVLAGLLGEAAAGLVAGVGPIFAGGILSRLVSGTPAATSGIANGLVEAGIPADEAAWHERAIEQGRVLLVVAAGTRRDEAAAMLERAGGSRFKVALIEGERLPGDGAGD